MKIIRLKNTVYYLSFILLLFSPLSVFAQNSMNVREWLDKSSKAIDQIESMSVYFAMNIIMDVSNKVSESFDGKIDIKGNKFHLVTPNVEIWFDGKNQWILQKGLEEINIIQPNEQDIQTLNPMSIFNIYKKDCKYKNNGKKQDLYKRIVQEIELIPKQTNNNVNKIIVHINPDDFMPMKIHIFFSNKSENIIYINKYQKNVSLSDHFFVFDKKKYPNIEIIDLR